MVTPYVLKSAMVSGIGLFVLGNLVTLLVWSTLRTLYRGITHVKRLHQIPCHRCLYFTGDYRLKCTVEPITACSEEAIGCCHYEPRPNPINHNQSLCPLRAKSKAKKVVNTAFSISQSSSP